MRVYGVLIKLIGPISPKTDFETKLETLVSPVAATRRLNQAPPQLTNQAAVSLQP